MPYSYSGVCYADAPKALEAFRADFPFNDPYALITHVSSSVTTTGLISYTANHRLWGNNTLSSRTGTIQLPSCATVTAKEFDPVTASGAFILFFSAVVSIFWLTKNISLILEAVKKW